MALKAYIRHERAIGAWEWEQVADFPLTEEEAKQPLDAIERIGLACAEEGARIMGTAREGYRVTFPDGEVRFLKVIFKAEEEEDAASR